MLPGSTANEEAHKAVYMTPNNKIPTNITITAINI